ncbi:MAG: hypothetical protein RML12_07530 [Xanthomonadales bacterium]|nr:hypothetical protein [Xanthomonadales bacterium]
MSLAPALVLASLLVAAAATAAPPPVEDFFRDPEFQEVTLSPRGDYLTVAVPKEDRTYLVVLRTRDKKVMSSWDFGRQRHASDVRWVGDERFFVTVRRKLGSFDVPVADSFDVYASNVDGKRRRQIPDANKYQFVALLPDDPDHVLVQRSIDNAFLFKLNVWDGETAVVASAPLRRGTFLVDHDGRPRYAIGSDERNDTVILRRESEGWTEVQRAPFAGDVRVPIAFAADNRRVYFTESERGRAAGGRADRSRERLPRAGAAGEGGRAGRLPEKRRRPPPARGALRRWTACLRVDRSRASREQGLRRPDPGLSRARRRLRRRQPRRAARAAAGLQRPRSGPLLPLRPRHRQGDLPP